MSEKLLVCPFDDLEVDAARRVDVGGHRLAVVRLGDDVLVLGDRCSHADYSLSEGEVDAKDKSIECWKHGSTFSLETGQPECLPATKPVPVYDVVIEEGNVHIVVSDGSNS